MVDDVISPQGEQIQPVKKPQSKEELEELNDRLSYAARRGHFEDIKFCLNEGADINTKESNERTPLWSTVCWNRSGSNEIIALLLEKGADIEIPDGDGETPLWRAAANGHEEIVKLLLKEGAKVDAKDNDGVTPLWRAMERKETACIDLLIEHGANSKVRDNNDRSMAFHAAALGNERILKSLLLDDKEDVNSKDRDGKTVLWHAIASQNQDCIDLVLQLNPDVDVRDVNASSLFHEAAQQGSATVLQYLLSKTTATNPTNWKDADGHTPLWLALESQDQACIDLLFEQNPDVDVQDKENGNMLHQAVRFGNEKALKLLSRKMRKTISIEERDSYGRTPLWLAVSMVNVNSRERGTRCVRVLLGEGAKTDAQDNEKVSIVHQAVRNKDFEIVKMLLVGVERGEGPEVGADIIPEPAAEFERTHLANLPRSKSLINTKDQDADSPLMQAIRDKSHQIRDLLHLEGADLETTDGDGRTPLWLAVAEEDIAYVNWLLIAEANVNAKDKHNVSVLHRAVRTANLALVKSILGEARDAVVSGPTDDVTSREVGDQGGESNVGPREHISDLPLRSPFHHASPDVNTKDDDGESPLLSAVMHESKDMVALLIARKATLGAFDGDGDSELGRAAYHGNKEIVEALLKHGADTEKANQQGRTPLHWAAWGGHTEIGELLLTNDCDIATADKDGETPFYYAVYAGHLEFVKLLLDTSDTRSTKKAVKGSKPRGRSIVNLEAKFSCGGTILHIAVSKGHKAITQLLLDSNANFTAVNKKGATPLHVAVDEGSFSSAKLLLAKMDEVGIAMKNSDGDTILHLACLRENINMVEELLSTDSPMSRDTAAEKNANNETPLSIAVKGKVLRILQLLVNYEADIRYSEEDDPNRKWAVMEDPSHDVAATGELLDSEVSWGSTDDTRTKTLYWAARNGYKPLVQKILRLEKAEAENEQNESGEDKSESDTEKSKSVEERSDAGDEERESEEEKSTTGKTLYWAAVGGQREIVKFLFELHEDFPHIKSEAAAGRAIQAAARNGHQSVVQQLITELIRINKETFSRGNENATNTNTWTPLHWAINYSPKEGLDTMRYMLMHGADPENGGRDSATAMAQNLVNQFPNDSQYDTILGLLQSPLRIPPKPIALVDPAIDHPSEANIVCKNFYSNIVDFYTSEGRFFTLERKSLVHTIIYDELEGPDNVMNDAKKKWKLDDITLEDRLRWIHLPANNWIWAEDLMTRIASESRKSAPEYTRLSKFVELNKREHPGKPQCRFMYPSLTFESRDFHSGEGVNIPKLQGEARRRKKADREKSEQVAAEKLEPPVEHGEQPLKGKDPPKPNSNDKPAAKGNEGKDTVPKTTKKELDDKLKVPKTATSHLKGSRLSLCIPYVTSQTVRSHRALRQAIRLAEAVKQKKKAQKEQTQEATANQETPQVEATAEENEATLIGTVTTAAEQLLRQQAREEVLEVEIANGLILLGELKSKFYVDLYKLADKTVSEIKACSPTGEQELKSWLDLLKAVHRKIRRSVEMCTSHKIMEWLERLFDAIEIVQQGGKNTANMPMREQLLEYYLNPANSKGLHASRTLDQYYYAALEDTSRRDIDQVVRRFQARKMAEEQPVNVSTTTHRSPRDRAKEMEVEEKKTNSKEDGDNGWEDDPDAQIAMVDQLWLWVIDDETVITCFPGSWDPEGKNSSVTELLDTIRKHIHAERRPQISSVYHLATIIASLCVGYVEQCKADLDHCKDSFLYMFASSIGIAADEEVKCFETFKTDLRMIGSDNNPDKETVQLNIVKEITLLEEIKDIRDELNILRSIFEDQRALLGKLLNLVAKPQPAGGKSADTDPILHYYQERSDIDLRIEKVEKMDIDATKTYDSINHLLDLRQKNANLYEAVQAREQAEQGRRQAEQASIQAEKATEQAAQTVKQGRIILVFTLVTIIFLPLSFLTSLYALNVESFPHVGSDFIFPSGWIFPRIFGTSAAIAIPLVCVAIYINPILDWYKDHVRPRVSWTFSILHLPNFSVLKQLGGRGVAVSEWKGIPPTATPSQMESQMIDSKSKEERMENKGFIGRPSH